MKTTFDFPGNFDMIAVVNLHNQIMFYLSLIFLVILFLFLSLEKEFVEKILKPKSFIELTFRKEILKNIFLNHDKRDEFLWTISPLIILFLIAIPSFILLYRTNGFTETFFTLKVIGKQWYWNYQWSIFETTFSDYDSYMLSTF
jgi:hypothetical protein